MIKLENTVTPSPEQWRMIIMGMRNPMNSWEKSDSGPGCDVLTDEPVFCEDCTEKYDCSCSSFLIGPNDHELMMKLAKGGPVHAKYRRMIIVYVDITAPLYWWKEFDTYKVGTVANSCSTMHKIHEKEFTLEDFSCENLTLKHAEPFPLGQCDSIDPLKNTIAFLNEYRRRYNDTTDPEWKKRYFNQMIQLLPTSYNQKRTVMMSYEVLHGIYKSRKNHKLDEWRELCKWIEELPYSEVITLEEREDENE